MEPSTFQVEGRKKRHPEDQVYSVSHAQASVKMYISDFDTAEPDMT